VAQNVALLAGGATTIETNMGLLSKLFGTSASSVERAEDRVWLTSEAKFAGIAKEIESLAPSKTAAVLLVAYFPDVRERLSEICNSYTGTVPMHAALASDLTGQAATPWHPEPSTVLEIIVAERHPLASAEERLVAFAEQLPCRCRLVHHVSLEDPTIKALCGDSLIGILKQLGMKESESIQSSMVTCRIQAALQKLENRTWTDFAAGSAREWIENNLPDVNLS
jgi:hypothetical protein